MQPLVNSGLLDRGSHLRQRPTSPPPCDYCQPCLVLRCSLRLLYHAVPDVQGDYEVALGQARVVREGRDVTLVSWGQQVLVAELAVSTAAVPVVGLGDPWLRQLSL